MQERTYTIRDPFVGELDIFGESLTEAIEDAYKDIPPKERPAYVWYKGEKIQVLVGGTCYPVQ